MNKLEYYMKFKYFFHTDTGCFKRDEFCCRGWNNLYIWSLNWQGNMSFHNVV